MDGARGPRAPRWGRTPGRRRRSRRLGSVVEFRTRVPAAPSPARLSGLGVRGAARSGERAAPAEGGCHSPAGVIQQVSASEL